LKPTKDEDEDENDEEDEASALRQRLDFQFGRVVVN
jgi:hypothetical protein